MFARDGESRVFFFFSLFIDDATTREHVNIAPLCRFDGIHRKYFFLFEAIGRFRRQRARDNERRSPIAEQTANKRASALYDDFRPTRARIEQVRERLKRRRGDKARAS